MSLARVMDVISVILSLSKDGHGRRVARYAPIVAGAGNRIARPSFDRLRMTRMMPAMAGR